MEKNEKLVFFLINLGSNEWSDLVSVLPWNWTPIIDWIMLECRSEWVGWRTEASFGPWKSMIPFSKQQIKAVATYWSSKVTCQFNSGGDDSSSSSSASTSTSSFFWPARFYFFGLQALISLYTNLDCFDDRQIQRKQLIKSNQTIKKVQLDSNWPASGLKRINNVEKRGPLGRPRPVSVNKRLKASGQVVSHPKDPLAVLTIN